MNDRNKTWGNPNCEWVTINIDACLVEEGFRSLDESICNDKGQIIGEHSSKVQGDKDPTAAEAMAMKVAMERALTEERTRVMFQSDNKNLINVMNDSENSIPRNALGVHCKGMWKMRVLFENVGFIHRMARVESQRVQLSIIHTIVKSGLRLNSFFLGLAYFQKIYISSFLNVVLQTKILRN